MEGSLSERRSAGGWPVQKRCAVSDVFEIKAMVTASRSTEVARASAGEPGTGLLKITSTEAAPWSDDDGVKRCEEA